MTVVVGLAPGERDDAGLHLGALLARSTADDLCVAVVVPTPWPPNPYRADLEFQQVQEREAQGALESAAAVVGPGLAARFRLHRARSVSSGLLEVVEQESATSVVLGSATSGGLGRVSLGGVAERVLHSSAVPLSLAPRGFVAPPAARLDRITVGFGRADAESDLLPAAAAVADRVGAAFRVACFAVRPEVGISVEAGAESVVLEEWRHAVQADVDRAAGRSVEVAVGQGPTWTDAIADVGWSSTEVLAVGANSSAVSRFFLGSHASKIVRSAPVPVTLVPRRRAEAA
ncbi:universal stress protein [Microlunatus flavus]|uniref:Universal stress protein family protein n=1 Tax=Microlunatus flavus TaxID=1036181 RepID=A0A1H9LNG5_9ACTN|nr:universal stress protein [Microlunatus flavus]SER12956.1 Universal stress protein family protein [Microlunatus flavus]